MPSRPNRTAEPGQPRQGHGQGNVNDQRPQRQQRQHPIERRIHLNPADDVDFPVGGVA
jgi:hypothetical protein